MKLSIAFLTLATSFAFACSSPSSPSGAGPACTNPSASLLACDKCLIASCNSLYATATSACSADRSCEASCTCDDDACIGACVAKNSAACTMAESAVSSCAEMSCAAACTTAATGDSGVSKDSGGTTDAESDDCNTVKNEASAISVTTSSKTAPTGTGGTVADGTYVLSANTIYAPAAVSDGGSDGGLPSGLEETLSVSGSTWQMVITAPADGGTSESSASLTFAGKDDTFSLTETCGESGLSQSGTYTASSTQILLIEGTAGYSVVATFTKK